ncbi:MAG: hypothetical protein K9M82_06880 [Deltaproteobacteria bacterium]|nr:hypothetical protein [Deltaproteobacteria bacterium]
MAFFGRKREILPWVVVYLIGAVLGRNICHHAGWPWWIGFTVIPALFVLAGMGLNALLGKRTGRSSKQKRDPHP